MRPSRAFFAAIGVALLPAASFAAEVRLAVSGSAEVVFETVEVRVDLKNQGDAPAATLTVEGELLGARDSARLETGIAAGASRSVLLRFPARIGRVGLHPLILLFEYPDPATRVATSQRAFLLLSLGAVAEPAVRIRVPELSLDTAADLTVGLESTDRTSHRVRIDVHTPRGLRVDPPEQPIVVPASGEVTVSIRCYRGAAARGSGQGILVVARAEDGDVERTAIATGLVRVLPDPALLPRLRPWLFAIALALLILAIWEEVRAFRRRPA